MKHHSKHEKKQNINKTKVGVQIEYL